MTREDIIRMAREAGLRLGYSFAWEHLERFAALVAAQEREKVAAWMIQRGYATGHGDTMVELLKELEWQIAERIAAEREACAKVAEKFEPDEKTDYVTYASTAIRAREEK